MQTYVDLSGSTLLYALVIAGLVFVAVLCVIFTAKLTKELLNWVSQRTHFQELTKTQYPLR